MIIEALNSIKASIDGMGLYSKANIGALLPGNGIALYLSPSGNTTEDLVRNKRGEMYVVVNTKHVDQQQAVIAQDTIHGQLTKPDASYGAGAGWQIQTISTGTPASYTGTEADGAYIWTSILKVQINSKGAN